MIGYWPDTWIEWTASLLGAWLLADFLSGLFHWLKDRYGNPAWPIIGQLIVLPNQTHHSRPGLLCQGSYWNRNNTTIATSLLGAGLFFWCGPLCLAFLFLSQGNEVHAWAHQRCNRVIRLLQQLGVLQSPEQHRVHHQRPFDCYFCVMTGYLNPALHYLVS